MGIPPILIIEKLEDPTGIYDYVVFCGWYGSDEGYYVPAEWREYFKQSHGTHGLTYGEPWFYIWQTKKLYFKEKDYPFFMMKFGHMFHKRPWEY